MNFIQLFNDYLHPGGERASVDRIYRHLGTGHRIQRCLFNNKDWTGEGAPSRLGQVCRMFYNRGSAERFSSLIQESRPQAAIFHNIFPVASPAMYRVADRHSLPVIQFLHNFRPFSISGTLFAGGQVVPEALHGDYRREIMLGSWQDSKLKSLLFGLMLMHLHRSGWLRSVKAWVAISDFVRDRMIEAGVPAGKVHTLRHSWDALPEAPAWQDEGYYLFLGRLVHEKGVHVLLEAWELLHKESGSATPPLVIAGKGPLAPLVREMAERVPSIRYVGQVTGEAKQKLLQGCRAVLVPSIWWEPLGLVVYEAYDFGKPVIAARSGGLCETVAHGVTGFGHQPGSAEGLLKNIRQMQKLTSQGRQQLGADGRAWLLRETNTGKWRRAFDKIAETTQTRTIAMKKSGGALSPAAY